MTVSVRAVPIIWALVLTGCANHQGPGEVEALQTLPEPLVSIDNPNKTVADYLACLREQNVMIVSAHRGGPQPGFAENGLTTFANSLSTAPFFIETDVRMTSDGIFVLVHDDELDRTTTGTGSILETSFEELDGLQLVDDDGVAVSDTIPTLEAALDWARGRAMLQLDVKSGAPITRVAELVVESDAQAYAAVIAYTVDDALAAAAVSDELTVSVEIMDLARLDALEAAGLSADRIMAWTGIEIERPELWAQLNDRGVSAAWGSLWYLDRDVMETGNMMEFGRLADEGLDVLSSDIHEDAYEAVETRQDTVPAIRRCNTQAKESARPR